MSSASYNAGLDIRFGKRWIIQSPKSCGILILILKHEAMAIDEIILCQSLLTRNQLLTASICFNQIFYLVPEPYMQVSVSLVHSVSRRDQWRMTGIQDSSLLMETHSSNWLCCKPLWFHDEYQSPIYQNIIIKLLQ